MINPDLLSFIIRNLYARKLRSVLTVLGISVGIAAVIALVMLSSGLKNGIAQEFATLGTDKIFVTAASAGFGPPGTAVSIPLGEKEEEAIQDISGVKVATGRLIRSVLIESEEEIVSGALVSMADEADAFDVLVEFGDYEIRNGRWAREGSMEVVLGYTSAALFDEEPLIGDTLVVNGYSLKIVGDLESTGNPQFDDGFMMSEESLREVLELGDVNDVILIQVFDVDEIPVVQARVEEELRDIRDVDEGSEDFSVEQPADLLEALNSILSIVQGVLVGIAAISLFVGSVGIMNTMYTSVVERTREIGILRAVGAQSTEVRVLFLLESGILGLLGGFIGVLVGLMMSFGIEFVVVQILEVTLLDVQFSFALVMSLLIVSTVIGAISGYFPSKEASSITPLEAIRQ